MDIEPTRGSLLTRHIAQYTMCTARAVHSVMVNIDAPYCERYSRAMKPAVAGIAS